jgi:hypothetical protein
MFYNMPRPYHTTNSTPKLLQGHASPWPPRIHPTLQHFTSAHPQIMTSPSLTPDSGCNQVRRFLALGISKRFWQKAISTRVIMMAFLHLGECSGHADFRFFLGRPNLDKGTILLPLTMKKFLRDPLSTFSLVSFYIQQRRRT